MPEKSKLGYLLFLVSRGHYNLANRIFNQVGLFRGQPPVLFQLGKSEGITQSELAETLEITQATLTNLLHRMETAGLVTRQRDVQDGRFTRIYLTDAGRKKLDLAVEQTLVMDGIAFSGFSEEEKETMMRFLEKIHTNIASNINE